VLSTSPLASPTNIPKIKSWFCPWDPFPGRPEFEFAAEMVELLASNEKIDRILKALTELKRPDEYTSPDYQEPYSWLQGLGKITGMRSAKDFHKFMNLAKTHILAVWYLSLALATRLICSI
jgi:hypothetical protein